MNHPHAERRGARGLTVVAGVAVLVLLAAVIPSPYVIERPGPVVDVLGSVEIDGEKTPVLEVAGGRDVDGDLNLLTVSTHGAPGRPASWLSLLPALVDPSQQAVPMDQLYPAGVTEEQVDSLNEGLMTASQTQAEAAAARALGEPVEVRLRVAEVQDEGAAAGLLEKGDEIRSVDGEAVEDFPDLRDRLARAGVGRPLEIGVERHGEALSFEVTLRASEGSGPMLGVTISSDYDLPIDADFSLDRIGGPSAGLMFALGIYAELAPEDPLGGQRVSGTGTIDDRGGVGAIGGLTQKMWAASRAGGGLFLMPLGNCADLPERIPPGLEIAPVATLGEAVAAIEGAAEGKAPAGIAACEAGGAGGAQP